MNNIPFEDILFLGLIYLLFPIWLKLFRKLNCPDFITFIWTGFFLGGLVVLIQSSTFLKFTFLVKINSLYVFILYFSLFLFLVQLGNNINLKTIRNLSSGITYTILIFLFLNLVLIGGGVYYFVLRSDIITAIIVFLAFLSINIGPLMMQYVKYRRELHKEVLLYIQLATLIDIFIIIAFSVMHTLINIKLSKDIFGTEVLILIILFAITIITSLKSIKGNLKSLIQNQNLEYIIPIGIGIILVVFIIGIRTDISLFLLAIWFGIILNLMGGSPGSRMRTRLNSFASVLYPVPFIEVGRIVFMDYHQSLSFWLYLNYFILAPIVTAFLFGIYMRIRGENKGYYFFSFFARGEISLIILWMVYRQNLVSNHLFIAAVIAIVLSTLVSQFFLTKRFAKFIGSKINV